MSGQGIFDPSAVRRERGQLWLLAGFCAGAVVAGVYAWAAGTLGYFL